MKKWMTGILTAFMMVLTLSACAVNEKTVSEPFNYSGYNTADYNGYRKQSEYVEMSDGTKLAVDIYLPGNTDNGESFPVIFQYTPYGRAYVIPDSVDQTIAEKIGILNYDLSPVSWTFVKGHRIRVSIACADSPTFEITPELSTNNDAGDPSSITPGITVYRTEEYPSGITLPVKE